MHPAMFQYEKIILLNHLFSYIYCAHTMTMEIQNNINNNHPALKNILVLVV